MHAATPASLLAEIDAAEQHSLSISRAERAGRFVILWGAVWMVCYAVGWRRPDWSGAAWMLGTLAGIAGTTILATQMSVKGRNGKIGRQLGIAAGAFYAFVGACCAILHPDPLQSAAFFSLSVALGYVLLGLAWSARITAAGLLIMAMTLIGWFALHDHFLPWMSGCGALLIVSGLVMRRA